MQQSTSTFAPFGEEKMDQERRAGRKDLREEEADAGARDHDHILVIGIGTCIWIIDVNQASAT